MAVSKEIINNSLSTLYKNVSSDQIQITVDKLKLKLEAFEKSNKRTSDWCAWLGIFLTSIAAITTSSFHDTIGISANTWEIIFSLAAIVSLILLIISLFNNFLNKVSINDFINDCMKSE